MNIPINKDIETEYQDQIINGFTLKEGLAAAAAIGVVVAAAAVVYYQFGLSPKYGCYIGIPLAFPVLFLGFRKFQGLSASAYVREILYEHRTKTLAFDAGEIEEGPYLWTLRKEKEKSGRKKK